MAIFQIITPTGDPETLAILRQSVAKAEADLGIEFDGDGDRIGIVDAKGRQYPVIS